MTNPNQHSLTLMGFDFPGKIFRSPMPYSSFDHTRTALAEMIAEKVDLVVVLVEQHEWWNNTGMDLPAMYAKYGMRVVFCPVEDFRVPQDTPRFLRTADLIIREAQAGTNVAVHCLAGLGRTGMLLALVANRALGLDGTRALYWVRQYVHGAVENDDQIAYVVNHSR